jgi:hypothetical protein
MAGHHDHWFLIISIILAGLMIFLPLSRVKAAGLPGSPIIKTVEHWTVIINQVRGTECCGEGSLSKLQRMLSAVTSRQLPATWTVRYDALQDPAMVAELKKVMTHYQEIGGFLEITPSLASASGVPYHGTPQTWYEAAQAYLIGYTPAERIKLIDTYMTTFKQQFGQYPMTTTAWMMDAGSLRYLREKYGVLVHEITREQWGTDSYTLDGGPPHLPYWPSDQWAMVPSATTGASLTMPLIVRQTISDPVHNYGDITSSYTSQPNDYAQKNRGLSYFQKLFAQAHTQPLATATWALVGLENSMGETDISEFIRQLDEVKQWRSGSSNNHVDTAVQYLDWRRHTATITATPEVLTGQDVANTGEQAWWVTTARYRLRLRLSQGELFVSDIRLYDPQLADPYLATTSGRLAYWITPFLLNGARFFDNDNSGNGEKLDNDSLATRREPGSQPTRWTLLPNVEASLLQWQRAPDSGNVVVKYREQTIAVFTPTLWELTTANQEKTHNQLWQSVIKDRQWLDRRGQAVWGVKTMDLGNGLREYQPFIRPGTFPTEQRERHPLLFPELKAWPLSASASFLQVSNRYAQAGRNPIRLVLSPRDEFGYPVMLTDNLQVTTTPNVNLVQPQRAGGQNGLVYLDLHYDQPAAVQVQIQVGDYQTSTTVYFAPDCKNDRPYCVQHPLQAWWFVRNWLGDQWRARQPQP